MPPKRKTQNHTTPPPTPSQEEPQRDPSPSPSQHCKEITRKTRTVYQRLHLVVDLDATCVSTLSFDDDTNGQRDYEKVQRIIEETEKTGTMQKEVEDLKRRVHIFSLNEGLEPYKMWTILRPDIFEFFEFAALYFSRITIWSAGKEDYVNEITSLLFPPYMPRPELVLSWGDCMKTFVIKDAKGKRKIEKTTSDVSSSGSTKRQSFGKPLDYLSSMISDDTVDPKHMLIIDDRSDIASENINNLIQVPPYSPVFTADELLGRTNVDTALRDFTKWLMFKEVSHAPDIRLVDKTCIFNNNTSQKTHPPPKLASPSHKKSATTKKKSI